MIEPNPKADLVRYLRSARDALLWKLEGLSEYDARRPLTPTGTNLLGLVKHAAGVELGYFGETFDRPYFVAGPPPAWYGEGAELNADMWATAEESREEIVGFYRRAWQHADATIEALPLDAVGHVPWWPEERRAVTLHRVLVHVISDITRHAGHADIVRELMDGTAGLSKGNDNMPFDDRAAWEAHRGRVEEAARTAGAAEGAGG
ncbi:DinB family protein [Streptomyces mayteni]